MGSDYMKQPKRLTLEQKKAVSAAKLLPENWQLVEQTETHLKIINKESGKTRKINRYAVLKKGGK